MTLARVLLLPDDHPTACLAACLEGTPCRTWFTQVFTQQTLLGEPGQLLEEAGVAKIPAQDS